MSEWKQATTTEEKPQARSVPFFRRNPDTGMVQMAKAKGDTAEELATEQRKYGSQAFRLSQYFERVFSGIRPESLKKPDCEDCNDSGTVSMEVETNMGVYSYAFQCACQSKATGFGARFLMNIKDLEAGGV